MQQTELGGLEKRLVKLEKSLAGLRRAAQRGCPLSTTLDDIDRELIEMSKFLKSVKESNENRTNQEYDKVAALFKRVRDELESIADVQESADQGITLTSSDKIPSFIYRLSSRFPRFWKAFEYITAALGIAMVPFSIWFMTYLIAFWRLPFLPWQSGMFSGLNMAGFAVGFLIAAVFHEGAHGIVLANNGIKIRRVGAVIGLLVGGMVEADEETFEKADPKVKLRFNAASIGNNALIAILLELLWVVSRVDFFAFMAIGDLVFGVMNSMPVSPKDGGWVYDDLVDMYLHSDGLKKAASSVRFILLIGWVVLLAWAGFAKALG